MKTWKCFELRKRENQMKAAALKKEFCLSISDVEAHSEQSTDTMLCKIAFTKQDYIYCNLNILIIIFKFMLNICYH